ncbi:hypothetical protein MSAN_02457900 [Mycena sanguinolenta]|uniref:Uncharacterized protein n=1 Tax=Mycena sanguinolenta TaxID=230812 RepID=A0A8H7CAM0_9AGAR|nr:hypothetical protein MSAN_02457900 [Mycena sanguinolenta]
MEYWFATGVHPLEARLYDDAVEADMCIPSLRSPSPYPLRNDTPALRRVVFARELREADEDTERILKEEVPRERASRVHGRRRLLPSGVLYHRRVSRQMHIHCFTDSADFAQNPIYISITVRHVTAVSVQVWFELGHLGDMNR